MTNLHRRYAGVAGAVRVLVPRQQRHTAVAVLDLGRLGLERQIGWSELLRFGWRPPAGCRHRIWHSRRTPELLLGWFLRSVLRQPWKLVYTSPSPRRHGWVWRGIVNRADALIAVTPRAASFLDWSTAIVPHGVDTDEFHPPPDKLRAWSEGGLPGKYGIGIFGRIRKSKGTDLFVEAMCELLPRHPDFCAVIAGFCKPGERGFRNALERRIHEAGLTERIVFLGDLAPADIKLWYQRIALCVAPPRSEGYGMTPMEAMASGAAAVTSREGCFPVLIVPGVNGDIVDTGDGAALTRAIEALIADPQALLELGRRARAHIVAHGSIESEVAGIHAVYETVLGEPLGGVPGP